MMSTANLPVSYADIVSAVSYTPSELLLSDAHRMLGMAMDGVVRGSGTDDPRVATHILSAYATLTRAVAELYGITTTTVTEK